MIQNYLSREYLSVYHFDMTDLALEGTDGKAPGLAATVDAHPSERLQVITRT